jgi:Skp family chaperone for outer membrane proteins
MLRKLCFGLAAVIFTLAIGPASAAPAKSTAAAATADAPTARILLVDSQEILRDSLAAKDIRRQIDSYRTRFQGEINTQEEGLRKDEAELKRQRAVLSADAFEDKRRGFEEKVTGVQRGIQERNQRLERALNQATDSLRRSLAPIFADIMKARGANLLLDQNQVLVGAVEMDVTKEAIRRLDQKLPSVKVVLPSAADVQSSAGSSSGQ